MKLTPSILAVAMTFVAGDVDGLILAATGRYASHMSGTTSGLARDLVHDPLALAASAGGVLLAFVLGACFAGWLLAATEDARRRHLPLLLTIEAMSLLIVILPHCSGPP